MTTNTAGNDPSVKVVEPVAVGPSRSLVRRRLDAFFSSPRSTTGVVVLLILVLFCFVGPLVYHTNQVTTDITQANQPPGNGHPLGTDPAGYDVLGRLMVGGRVSLEIGLAAALIATFFGALWGAIAGYCGGVIDSVMMRIVDAMLAIPSLFFLLVLVTIIKPSVGVLILVIGLSAWLMPSRLVRAETISLRARDYVQAVRMMGGDNRRAVMRHIIPNVAGTVIVNATFQVADAILVLAYLGFLGLGLQPPTTDWGAMLSNGVNFIYLGKWWLIYPPGIAIVLAVLAVNFIGDGIRDVVTGRA